MQELSELQGLYARRLAREVSARTQAETLLEQKSLELFQQAQQRELAVAALRESEERYRLIVELSPDAILIEVKEKIVFANNAAQLLFCSGEDASLFGKSLIELTAESHRSRAKQALERIHAGERCMESEELAIRLDGSSFEVSVQRAALHYDGEAAVQMVARDISARKKLEQDLAYQAAHDPLTGVPNRTRLMEILLETLHSSDRYQFPVWVAFLDLDRFKFINDQYGHRVGDQVLVTFTSRLQSVLRKSDAVGRFGGDEFILVLRGTEEHDTNHALVERLMSAINEPIEIDGYRLQMTCSLGLASYPKDGNNPHTLIENADAAMYSAKKSGRDQCHFFSADMKLGDAASGNS